MADISDLKALWMGVRAFTEAAGTFGTDPQTNGVVKAFVSQPDAPGAMDKVRPIRMGRYTEDNKNALTDVLIAMEAILTKRILPGNGFDPDKYTNSSSFNGDTTFFELEMHLVSLYSPDLFTDPDEAPEVLPHS